MMNDLQEYHLSLLLCYWTINICRVKIIIIIITVSDAHTQIHPHSMKSALKDALRVKLTAPRMIYYLFHYQLHNILHLPSGVSVVNITSPLYTSP